VSTVRAALVVSTYCTGSDVSQILNLIFSSNSVPNLAQVNDLIVRATSFIIQISGHNWASQQVVETYDAIGSGQRAGTIILRNRPTLSVDKVEWWYAGIQAWMPGLNGFPEQSTGILVGPSGFATNSPTFTQNQQQPQTYLVYLPEGKVVWNTLRLDSRLHYRVTYTWGYTVPPDFIRDLASTMVARDILTFWASQLNIQEDINLFKKRLDEKIFRLTSRASQRPATAIG
jgi:hypothetical protein